MAQVGTPNPFLANVDGLGPVILDGGLATALEDRGFDLDDDLWSARLLIEAPHAVRRVHHDFLAAGADCIATVSYQASVQGFMKRGLERREALGLLQRSVDLAVEARDAFWHEPANRVGRIRPLVAASVGPYGAYLADGSEYTGAYGVDSATLREFHRERWHLFAESDADLLACETIPSLQEAEVLAELMRETPETWAWLSVSCRDEGHLSDGTPVAELATLCDGVPNLAAVGVNCTKPEYIGPLLTEMARHTSKPLLAYPNAGEDYDITTRSWASPPSQLDWCDAAAGWVELGARGIGGCCRVRPEQITSLRASLRQG